MNDLPEDRRWAAVLLLCGNLGLGGSWDGSRRLLTRLAELVIPGAVLAGDSVTPDGQPRTDLRIRYRGLVTPWWPQYNIPASGMAALVEGTGWRIEQHEEDGDDHAVLLRRTSDPDGRSQLGVGDHGKTIRPTGYSHPPHASRPTPD